MPGPMAPSAATGAAAAAGAATGTDGTTADAGDAETALEESNEVVPTPQNSCPKTLGELKWVVSAFSSRSCARG